MQMALIAGMYKEAIDVFVSLVLLVTEPTAMKVNALQTSFAPRMNNA